MRTLAGILGTVTGVPVVDRTGVAETFDVELHWSRQTTPSDAAAADIADPPLVAALQEQLGLKLETVHELKDILLIDHVELPSVD